MLLITASFDRHDEKDENKNGELFERCYSIATASTGIGTAAPDSPVVFSNDKHRGDDLGKKSPSGKRKGKTRVSGKDRRQEHRSGYGGTQFATSPTTSTS